MSPAVFGSVPIFPSPCWAVQPRGDGAGAAGQGALETGAAPADPSGCLGSTFRHSPALPTRQSGCQGNWEARWSVQEGRGVARVSPLSPRQRCARAAPVPGFAVSESEDVHGKLKGVIYQCWSPEAQGLSGTKKSHPSQWGSELPFVLVFFLVRFLAILFLCGCRSCEGEQRGRQHWGLGSRRDGWCHSPSPALWKPLPSAVLFGGCSLCLQVCAQRRGSAVPPQLLPVSPVCPCLSVRVCVCTPVCRSDCLLLYNVFFSQCLWAMGLEVKHLLNCCQARRRVIKLPREKIAHSGVDAGEQG